MRATKKKGKYPELGRTNNVYMYDVTYEENVEFEKSVLRVDNAIAHNGEHKVFLEKL